MALLMAGESTVLPSPVAPKARTSKNMGVADPAAPVFCAAAKAGSAAAADAASPMLPSFSRSRRAESNVFIATAILTQRGLSFKHRCTYQIMLACVRRRGCTNLLYLLLKAQRMATTKTEFAIFEKAA
jgi:hypothetical protein